MHFRRRHTEDRLWTQARDRNDMETKWTHSRNTSTDPLPQESSYEIMRRYVEQQQNTGIQESRTPSQNSSQNSHQKPSWTIPWKFRSSSIHRPFSKQRLILWSLGILIAFIILSAVFLDAPENERTLFVHPSLQTDGDSLRLLHLGPGAGDDPIVCTMNSTTFFEAPEYSALSYQWGPKQPERWIKVNGADMNVTQSLYDALYHLRDHTVSRTIWVDALCINQGDLEEKNEQVRKMAHVYQRATEVMVWLGVAEMVNEHDMKALSQYLGGKKDAWRNIEWWIHRLIHQEYWKRAWIVQEIGIADEITVHFGSYSLPWSEFLKVVKEYALQTNKDDRVINILHLQELRKTKYSGEREYSLGRLLSRFRDVHCHNFTDKVYALRGLANDVFRDNLPVKYESSEQELYSDVIRFESLSMLETGRKQTQIVFLSGLVRRLLTRKSRSVRVTARAIPLRMKDYTPIHQYLMSAMRLLTASTEFLPEFKKKLPRIFVSYIETVDHADSLGAYIWADIKKFCWWLFRPDPLQISMAWDETGPESFEFWKHESVFGVKDIPLRGRFTTEVLFVGPSLDEILKFYHVEQEWRANLFSLHLADLVPLDKAITLNSNLMRIIKRPQKIRREMVQSFDASGYSIKEDLDESHTDMSTQNYSPHLFLGSDGTIGLIPPNIKRGDRIYQFWNVSAAAILRPSQTPQFLGRAVIVSSDPSVDWDVLTSEEKFKEGDPRLLDFEIDLIALTRLSLDVVDMPFTA